MDLDFKSCQTPSALFVYPKNKKKKKKWLHKRIDSKLRLWDQFKQICLVEKKAKEQLERGGGGEGYYLSTVPHRCPSMRARLFIKKLSTQDPTILCLGAAYLL